MKASTKKAIENAGMKVYGNYVSVSGELFPLPLVQGNEKLGKTVWHSSTVPTCGTISAYMPNGETITQKGTCPCSCDKCYATTGNYLFNSVKYSLIMRTKLLKEHMETYFQLVAIQIDTENIKKLRIHASGDFISGEAAGYYGILASRPHVSAWTYTKCTMSEDLRRLDSLNNCNIVKSIIRGHGFNFGTIAHVANMFYFLKRAGKSVYICRCGIDKEQHCSNCDGCSSHEYVLFVEHSTGYQPEKEKLLNKFIELVENQKNEVSKNA